MATAFMDMHKGLNFEGLLYDIHEDEGYEQYDLLLWVLERVITDVSDYLASGRLISKYQKAMGWAMKEIEINSMLLWDY